MYSKGSGFELTAFSDVDHAGCIDTRKSTSGGIQFLGDKLVSWMSKKQDCTAMSSAEAEYVALFASSRTFRGYSLAFTMTNGNPSSVNIKQHCEQSDWLADTDEEIDEQELEAHYSYMVKIQEVPNADSGTEAEPLEQVQYDTDDNVFVNDIQHFEQSKSITNTCVVKTGDSNVIPDSPDMCDNVIKMSQK
ncbi:putative ribonuclease H-like domain-containing protein [Tanacetum coccineum]